MVILNLGEIAVEFVQWLLKEDLDYKESDDKLLLALFGEFALDNKKVKETIHEIDIKGT